MIFVTTTNVSSLPFKMRLPKLKLLLPAAVGKRGLMKMSKVSVLESVVKSEAGMPDMTFINHPFHTT